MHILAEKVTLTGLKELGIVTGDIDEMVKGRVGFIFQPHGLGHLIGLDVHDVGGYLENYKDTPRDPQPGLKGLRCGRIMKPGMCVTIEPGCYFRDFLLKGELPKDQLDIDLSYINLEKIKEYQEEISGVRIEDIICITEDGNEHITKAIPRTVEEIEACMRGDDWKAL